MQHVSSQTQSRVVSHSGAAKAAITPEMMMRAGVPLALAHWYHCTAPNLKKSTLLDEIRISQVRTAVAAVT